MICFGDIVTFVKKNKNYSQQDWGKQFAKPFAYNFSMLIDNGKKVVCMQNEFKMVEDFMTSYYKNVHSCNRLAVVVTLFIFACLCFQGKAFSTKQFQCRAIFSGAQ